MSLEQVVILPHPPIALPEVAGHRFKDVKKTANGMIQLATDILTSAPETLIIITPHSNIHPSAFATFSDEEITGNFNMFGAPQVNIRVKNNLNMLKTITELRNKENKNDIIQMKPGTRLDHGSGVPLYYILKAGYKGSVVIFNYTYGSIEQHQDFGRTIAQAIEQSETKVTVVASGDLSHRIIPSAPAGFHPDGKKFDKFIVDAIESGNYELITTMDQDFRANAGECAYNSLMVAFGVLNSKKKHNKIYSYEAPFGVGYLVATL